MDAPPPFTWQELPEILPQLRAIAHALWRAEKAHSRDSGDFLDETLLELWRACQGDWANRGYFFAAFRRAARRKAIDWARVRHKRQGEDLAGSDIDALADACSDAMAGDLHRALERLAEKHPQWARAVTDHYFVGDSTAHLAQRENTSERTIRQWIGKGELALGVILKSMASPDDTAPDAPSHDPP